MATRRTRPPRLPPLTPEIVSDEAALGDEIDKVLLVDADLRRLSRRVRRLQRVLRGAVDEKGWHAYLRIEEASNERLGEALTLVARWAFEQGGRSGR